jgi:hypothetical protein
MGEAPLDMLQEGCGLWEQQEDLIRTESSPKHSTVPSNPEMATEQDPHTFDSSVSSSKTIFGLIAKSICQNETVLKCSG